MIRRKRFLAAMFIGLLVAVGACGIRQFGEPQDLSAPVGIVTVKGRREHGHIGIATVTSKHVISDAGTPNGVTVTHVTPDGPADRAGIEVGDVLLRIDGRPVTTHDDVVDTIITYDAGQTVVVETKRGEEQMSLPCTLIDRESFVRLPRSP